MRLGKRWDMEQPCCVKGIACFIEKFGIYSIGNGERLMVFRRAIDEISQKKGEKATVVSQYTPFWEELQFREPSALPTCL